MPNNPLFRHLLKTTTAIACVALTSTTAMAGWTSGGGELIRDTRNPWFLQNTIDVNYCVEIDEANFGQTRERAEFLIGKAIESWKEELKFAPPVGVGNGPSGNLQIGTQRFRQTACGPDTDLRFQLGVLSGPQMKLLEDPTRLVGVAVRTDYDRVTLRGKGFIYIAPSRGPLRFVSEDSLEEPWALENGSLLYAAVLHELGHVFGLPHSMDAFDLMGERFAENLIGKAFGAQTASFWSLFIMPPIFKYREIESPYNQLMMCSATSTTPVSSKPAQVRKKGFSSRTFDIGRSVQSEFFGIPADHNCLSQTLKNGTFEIYSMKSADSGSAKLLGKATLTRFDSLFDREPAFMMWLPAEQKVFAIDRPTTLISGPARQTVTNFKGTYRTTDGKISREIFIQAKPMGMMKIGGTYQGKVILNVYDGF